MHNHLLQLGEGKQCRRCQLEVRKEFTYPARQQPDPHHDVLVSCSPEASMHRYLQLAVQRKSQTHLQHACQHCQLRTAKLSYSHVCQAMEMHAAGNRCASSSLLLTLIQEQALHSEYHHDMCSVHIYCQANRAQEATASNLRSLLVEGALHHQLRPDLAATALDPLATTRPSFRCCHST